MSLHGLMNALGDDVTRRAVWNAERVGSIEARHGTCSKNAPMKMPFHVAIPKTALDDLQARLRLTRWAEPRIDSGWDYGTNGAYLRELCTYWQSQFDWRKQEQIINRFEQFQAAVDDVNIHFIHVPGKGNRAIPIVLTHGYPDSFLRFYKLIPLLTDPAAHGGDAGDAFDVVIPSIPGYGFSDKPSKPGVTFHIGSLWHKLMTEVLGYERYAAHGGDWGGSVTEQLARSHGRSLIGIHLTDVPFAHTMRPPDDPSRAEKKFLEKNQKWIQKEGAYALIQGTRPYTLAWGLNDSPIGLAAWIIDKFQAWSDCDGDVKKRFTKDELLTNVTLYWFTSTIDSSFLPYYDFANSGPARWIAEGVKDKVGSTDLPPAGFAIFPKDISQPPREWAERFFNVQRWSEMSRGGHFAAMEEPEMLADELRAFFRPLRSQSSTA
jgi:pimeloyl-ACP methyl ester carboxylesterase